MLQVVAGVLRVGDAVLLARRQHPVQLAGKWEFPGGKVDAGETPADALARELHEELGITVAVGAQLVVVEGETYDGRPMALRAHWVDWLDGRLVPHEHDAVALVDRDQLRAAGVLALDRAVVDALLEATPCG